MTFPLSAAFPVPCSPFTAVPAGSPHEPPLRHITPQQARWAAAEEWHPAQRGRSEPDGSYVLEVPYSDPRELVMDILRYGPDVEVLSPPELREQVRVRAGETVGRYAVG